MHVVLSVFLGLRCVPEYEVAGDSLAGIKGVEEMIESPREIVDRLRNSDCYHNHPDSMFRCDCTADCNKCVSDAIGAAFIKIRAKAQADERKRCIKAVQEASCLEDYGVTKEDLLWENALDVAIENIKALGNE